MNDDFNSPPFKLPDDCTDMREVRIGVDATVNETGTSARYLQFGVDEPGMIGSGGKMMRAIGKTAIELGPHKTYEQLR